MSNYDHPSRTVNTDPGTYLQGAIPSTIGQAGVPFVIPVALTAGGGGADDVSFTFPVKARVIDLDVHVTTAGGGGTTITLRTAAAGAGSAASSDLSTAAAGHARDALTTAQQTFAAAAVGYLRRTDNTCVGTAFVHCLPIQ